MGDLSTPTTIIYWKTTSAINPMYLSQSMELSRMISILIAMD